MLRACVQCYADALELVCLSFGRCADARERGAYSFGGRVCSAKRAELTGPRTGPVPGPVAVLVIWCGNGRVSPQEGRRIFCVAVGLNVTRFPPPPREDPNGSLVLAGQTCASGRRPLHKQLLLLRYASGALCAGR